MNHVVLIGRLTRDPELRYIAGTGTPVANFAIAVDREFSGKDWNSRLSCGKRTWYSDVSGQWDIQKSAVCEGECYQSADHV